MGDVLFLVRILSASAWRLRPPFYFHALSSEPDDGFDQTCIDTMLGGGEELIRFW